MNVMIFTDVGADDARAIISTLLRKQGTKIKLADMDLRPLRSSTRGTCEGSHPQQACSGSQKKKERHK